VKCSSVISMRLQEAQNIMALSNVETPLKGGVNTALVDSDFGGIMPTPQLAATANTVLATPFRTPGGPGQQGTPASSRLGSTPSVRGKAGAPGAGLPTATPLRDKLNINPEEELETEGVMSKQVQKVVRENLREQLGALPEPKNDYEIVVPDDEDEMDTDDAEAKARSKLEDKADVDRKAADEAHAKRMEEFKKLCKAVQQNLPRPMDVNESILRPPGMELSDLQKVTRV
jgi:pre-mRNA-splicing factor CDC5/CEF1